MICKGSVQLQKALAGLNYMPCWLTSQLRSWRTTICLFTKLSITEAGKDQAAISPASLTISALAPDLLFEFECCPRFSCFLQIILFCSLGKDQDLSSFYCCLEISQIFHNDSDAQEKGLEIVNSKTCPEGTWSQTLLEVFTFDLTLTYLGIPS